VLLLVTGMKVFSRPHQCGELWIKWLYYHICEEFYLPELCSGDDKLFCCPLPLPLIILIYFRLEGGVPADS
jgi:hypothetical protein